MLPDIATRVLRAAGLIISVTVLFTFAASEATTVRAADRAVAADPDPWTGTWSADDGATIITIASNNGFLDIMGKDAASIFDITCMLADVPDRSRAECVGRGVNHNSTLRFLYKSTMSINAKGNIAEDWQADFWDAKLSKRGVISGSAEFTKSKVQATESRSSGVGSRR